MKTPTQELIDDIKNSISPSVNHLLKIQNEVIRDSSIDLFVATMNGVIDSLETTYTEKEKQLMQDCFIAGSIHMDFDEWHEITFKDGRTRQNSL